MYQSRRPYSFSAIVGQEELKTAFLANIVNPNIGGILISGPKGTGKSTIVHSIEPILPEYEAVADCDFNCAPDRPDSFCTLCREKNSRETVTKKMKVVTLPLSCTEDRLIGSIDVETLLKTGEKKVQVGILGEANRNILYIDEVNLLPDHLVDDILDAAASPWNTIEREGISVSHPANFILIGTMNPEEGELRPQILDRFSLCVKVTTVNEPGKRIEIVKRNLLYENNPDKFFGIFRKDEEILAGIVKEARELLPKVEIDMASLEAVAESCGRLKVDGQRPDIVIVKTAQTIAAIDRRTDVNDHDILMAAEFTLSHRTRDGGLLEPPKPKEISEVFTGALKKAEQKRADAGTVKKFRGSSGDIDITDDEFLDRSPEGGGDTVDSDDVGEKTDEKKKTEK